jgi:hypothetical protein
METMIYLTKEQANKVRGKHGKYSELQPIVTEDGGFILPMDVIKDPEHKEVLDELLKCKEATLIITKVIDEKLPEDDAEREIYSVSNIKELTKMNI